MTWLFGFAVRLRLTVLALGLMAGLIGCSTVDTVGGWFGLGSGKVAKLAALAEFTPTLKVTRAWDAAIGSAGVYTFAPDSDGEGLYVAAADGAVASLDLASGQKRWTVQLSEKLSAGVSVGDGLVVVGTPKGRILALNAADGAQRWAVTLGGEILARPLVHNGQVLARSSDGRVFKLNGTDGKTLWSYSRSLPILTLREAAGLFADNEAVFAGHPGGRLTALAQSNGAPLWEANVALPRGATELERIADVLGTPAVEGRQVCAAAYQGRLACFDRYKGSLQWARDFAALRGGAVDARTVYGVDADSTVQAFDRERGVSPWKQDKLVGRNVGVPLALEAALVVSDFEGLIHLLKPDEGRFVARVATDGSAVRGEPLGLRQGFVVQTAKGGVFAFKIEPQP